MAIYFSIGTCQPFARMETVPVEGFSSASMVLADGDVVGLRLDDPREVLRLDDLIDTLNLNGDSIWSRLRADDDVLNSRRQATWGGGGS